MYMEIVDSTDVPIDRCSVTLQVIASPVYQSCIKCGSTRLPLPTVDTNAQHPSSMLSVSDTVLLNCWMCIYCGSDMETKKVNSRSYVASLSYLPSSLRSHDLWWLFRYSLDVGRHMRFESNNKRRFCRAILCMADLQLHWISNPASGYKWSLFPQSFFFAPCLLLDHFFSFQSTLALHYERLDLYTTTFKDGPRVTRSFSPSCQSLSNHAQHLPFASLILFS